MKLKNIDIVLVNPKYPENIGAACRAMKTMGIQSLSIVGSPEYDEDKIKTLALHASDIAEKARYFPNLPEAVKDAALVAGTSRRRGKKRKYFAVLPDELAVKISSNPGMRTAIVFGNEESGLSDEELACCHLVVNIPTSPEFPSLNLSHAVQIIAYAIYRESAKGTFPVYSPIAGERLDQVVSVITRSLGNIGFFTLVPDRGLSLFFRDILARSALSAKEARRLEVVFKKISGMVSGKGIE